MPSEAARAEFSAAELEQFKAQRIATITAEGAIRRIVCPKCKAQVGEDCRSPAWYRGSFHAERRRLAGVR